MTPNNNLNILPWYDSISRQNHRKSYAYDAIYPLATPNRFLPSFQIIRPTSDAQITVFKLHRIATGDEIDILSSIITNSSSGLHVWREGSENYNIQGSAAQVESSTFSSWGFSVGRFKNFQYLETWVRPFNASELPTSFRIVVRDSKGGTILGDETITNVTTVNAQPYKIVVDFGSIIENSAGQMLWVEVRSNGRIGMWGKDDTQSGIELDTYSTSSDINITPTTPVSSGQNGRFSGYCRAWVGLIDYDIIIYPAAFPFADVTPEGQYYAEMSDGTNTWFSEVFNICHTLDDLLKIKYWHDEAFVIPEGHIRYAFPYRNTVYLQTEIGKPEYVFEDKVRKRDGFNFPLYQVSWKLYKFEFLAPEYLLDAIRIIRQHHFVQIEQFGQTYNVDEFVITPEWLQQGDLAKVEAEFTTDTVITQTGRGKIPSSGGDYDSRDYNEDFLNQIN